MVSIIVLVIGVVVTTALLGSVAFQSLTPESNTVMSPLEQKCQKIADDGYRIHAMYPDSSPDELPLDDMNRLLYLDEMWIKECVSVLPADSIFSIANNVERDFSHGE